MSTEVGTPRLELRLDDLFRRRAVAGGAKPHDSENHLSREFLDDVEHFTSFPGVAIPVSDAPGSFHPPATCYRLFRDLAGHSLDSPVMFTVTGRCRRHEAEIGEPARLPEFTMRETVFLGAEAAASEWRADLMESERSLAVELGLDVELSRAQDLFFGSDDSNRGKRLLQKLLGLKYELVAPIAGKPKAISSFNLHNDFFTSRLDIDIDGVESPRSGCVAYGLERWAEAVRTRWGPTEGSWPEATRRLLGAHSAQ